MYILEYTHCLNTFKIEDSLNQIYSILFEIRSIMGHAVNHLIFTSYDNLA